MGKKVSENKWIEQALRSRIKPLTETAKTLRKHEDLILNYFRAKKEISNGITEVSNNNAKMAIRKARGFKSRTHPGPQLGIHTFARGRGVKPAES